MKIRLKMVGYYPFLLLLLIWMTAPTHGQKSNPYRKQLQEQQATESHRENQGKAVIFLVCQKSKQYTLLPKK